MPLALPRSCLAPLIGLSLCSSRLSTQAEVRMPAIFGNHMVLQEQTSLPIWGWAAAGEKITVRFHNQEQSTIASADGSWRVELAAVGADSAPATLSVSGQSNSLTFTDVLVGDVWLASGQSNMEFGLQTDSRGKAAIAQANDSQIRLFFVPWAAALQPQTNIGQAVPPSPLNGKWLVCNPQLMSSNWAWHGFSAVGYYFAQEIRRTTGRPIGLIGSYKGGTPAQAWTSLSGLQKESALAHYVAEHQRIVDGFAKVQTAYPQEHAAYEAKLKEWNAAAQKAKADGKPLPANSAPKAPTPPDGGYGTPANLFNGMIAPLIPYPLKGVIWYQGEGNANNVTQACEYATLFPCLISDWREKWSRPNLPFLFVQLPNINRQAREASEGIWPWLRESQLKTSSLPQTGMAVTIDVGEAEDLHPPDKLYVGQRLALVARHIAYDQDLVFSGPIYDSMTVESNRIRLQFKHVGSGLTLGTPPPKVEGTNLPPPKELTGFGIAGADHKFVWAKAVLEGDSVVVSSDAVPHPLAVRYDWGQNPFGNLYNKEHLPASPFRTDDWPPTPR